MFSIPIKGVYNDGIQPTEHSASTAAAASAASPIRMIRSCGCLNLGETRPSLRPHTAISALVPSEFPFVLCSSTCGVYEHHTQVFKKQQRGLITDVSIIPRVCTPPCYADELTTTTACCCFLHDLRPIYTPEYVIRYS